MSAFLFSKKTGLLMGIKNKWQNPVLNFLAVILGVYLAFYINENAKSNNDRKESFIWLKSLQTDLTDDIRSYEEYQIPVNKQHLQNVDTLLNALATVPQPETASLLGAIFDVQNYAPVTSTYSSMKASGKFALIEDMALKKQLTDYYESTVSESMAKGRFQVDYFTDELLVWMTNHADLQTMSFRADTDFTVLKNKLLIYSGAIEQKVENYERIVQESKALSDAINTYLQQSQH
ncbi:MAG: DUF6090 family protein [Bacteroidota bacterium]